MTNHPQNRLIVKLSVFSESHEVNRNELRKIVINYFIKERAGIGTGEDASNYNYIVESLSNQRPIYITRPAWQREGFDFLIHVESFEFRGSRPLDAPKHQHLLDDLQLKIESKPSDAKELFNLIDRVYRCEDPEDILEQIKPPNFTNMGHSVELLLKVFKWFFIEQDINRWNYSGRMMLWSSIKELFES